ncbi:hypothetical protein TNCV_4629281 [Trichonephila clavipes]|nr:hypothetical protein TNCV_4629281 [Trichonephila clavipes]
MSRQPTPKITPQRYLQASRQIITVLETDIRSEGKICRELKRPPVDVVWDSGKWEPTQVSSSSLDHGSKLRGPLSNPME